MNTTALEKKVIDALTSRGHSDNEARIIVEKLKKLGGAKMFSGVTDMELSPDGKYLAIANVTAVALSPSGKALLCEWNGHEEWMPVKQIVSNMSEVDAAGDIGTLVITRWIAEKKGFVVNGIVHKPTTKTP